MKKLYLIAFIAIFVWISPAFAATTIYDDETVFVAQTASYSYYLEEFSGYVYGSPFNGSQTTADFGPVSGFSWTASATGGLYSNNSALSINQAQDQLLITFTGDPVTAIGGIFAATDQFGMIINEYVKIMLSDGTVVEKRVVDNTPFFVGFISDAAISSMIIDGIEGVDPEDESTLYNWPQVNELYVGAGKTIIPEPSILLLLASGLIGLVGLGRRWNK